jgi:hypothetical protein
MADMISRARVLSLAAERLCHSVRTLPPSLSRAKGEESERLLREFLSAFLPKRFAVGTGYIVDRRETLSYETDVVIYDALHCAVYPLTRRVVMVPADAVAATIEVKARLYGGYLREEFMKARVVKSLCRSAPPPFIGLLAFGNKNPAQPRRQRIYKADPRVRRRRRFRCRGRPRPGPGEPGPGGRCRGLPGLHGSA